MPVLDTVRRAGDRFLRFLAVVLLGYALCGRGFAPDFGGANALTMLHRGLVLLIGAFLVYFLLMSVRQCARWARNFAIATLAALGAQVLVGAASAVTDGALANGFHVALGTLVWGGVCTTALLSLPRGDRVPLRAHGRVEGAAI